MSFERHGIFTSFKENATPPIAIAATTVLALVVTADDADAGVFPLGKSVLVTNTESAIPLAGTKGTMKASLEAISKQAGATAIIVRVAENSDENALNTNVIGGDTDGVKTGLQALLSAESKFGVKIDVMGAPGLDTLPVATEMASIAKKLDTLVYAYAHGATTKEQAKAYTDNFTGNDEIMIIWSDWSNRSAVAVALGMRAQIDASLGWNKTISNVPVSGVTGIAKDISYIRSSTSHDAHYLNSNHITTLVQNGGYVYWGNRMASGKFESFVRTKQKIRRAIENAYQWAIDQPITSDLIERIVEGINAAIRRLVNQGRLIGGRAWYSAANNPVDQLGAGKLQIDYEFTDTPTLEQLGFQQSHTDRFLINLAA